MISNNPPADAAFSLHIDELFTLLSNAGEVSNDEQEQAVDDLLDQFRKASKDADAARAVEKKPFDEQAKAVQAKWKPITTKADRGAAECKSLLTPYRVRKQAAKDEAARLARQEAEERQKAAQEALKASDDLEAKFHAEEQLKQASKLVASANRADREATGLRTVWEAEVTDRRAAHNHYIKTNPEAFANLIQELADRDARGSRAPVPGIIFHERKIAQ